jgi:hypothetical protein
MTIERECPIAPFILRRLIASDKLLGLIEEEQSLNIIADLLIIGFCADPQPIQNGKLLNLLARKIATARDFLQAAHCLWNVYRIYKQAGFELAEMCLQQMTLNKNREWGICELQNFKALSEKLKQVEQLPISTFKIFNIPKVVRTNDTKLWEFFDEAGQPI